MVVYLTVLVAATALRAEVLRVPEEYPFIQFALNATAPGDTVLVAVGDYAEALVTPLHFVHLLGDTEWQGDSLVRPVLDPSPLMNSNTLACLTVPSGSSLQLTDFVLRNRPPMLPHTGWSGGIEFFTTDSLIVERCLFDSVLRGIAYSDTGSRARMRIEHCEFHHAVGGTIGARGPAVVRECLFHGQLGGGMVVVDSSLVEGCQFSGNVETAWLGAYRGQTKLRDNYFGPGFQDWEALEVYSRFGGMRIERNVFDCASALEIGRVLVLAVSQGEPLICNGNVFSDTTEGWSGQPVIISEDGAVDSGLGVIFRDNVLDDYSPAGISGIWIGARIAGVEVMHNRFTGIANPGPVIQVDSFALNHTIRENLFSGSGTAVVNHSSFELDVRRNWWGDATGPYHSELNPGGLGDTLTGPGPYDIDPWQTDTLTWATSDEHLSTVPEAFMLKVFPNPTNAQARITLSAFHPTEVEMKLYDVLGREVASLWRGNVAGNVTRTVSLEQNASGIYFVRAVDARSNKTLVSARFVVLK